MNRSLWLRIARVFVALWTVALLSDASLLHSCPMHDGTIPANAGHLAVSGPSAPASGHHHEAPPADSGHGHACTCLGACTTGLVTTLSSPPVSIVVAAAPVVVVHEYLERVWLPAHSPALRLPFANGPPRAPGARDASPVRG